MSKRQDKAARPDQKILNVIILIKNMIIQNSIATICGIQKAIALILESTLVSEHPEKHHFD